MLKYNKKLTRVSVQQSYNEMAVVNVSLYWLENSYELCLTSYSNVEC